MLCRLRTPLMRQFLSSSIFLLIFFCCFISRI